MADTEKKEKEPKTYLNIPIPRDLRNRLKAKAALKGKNLYEYCAEILEESLNKEKDK